MNHYPYFAPHMKINSKETIDINKVAQINQEKEEICSQKIFV